MFRRLGIGLAAATVITALVVAPADAATYKVTATAPTKADLGTLFKVTGKSSANKTLSIQLLSGSAWKTVSTVKTGPDGKYKRSVKMPSVGARKFRVYAPKKGSVKAGVSPTMTVTGFTWLALAKQSSHALGETYVDVPAQVGSTTYSRSILLKGSGQSYHEYNVAGRCDLLNLGMALDSRFPGSTGAITWAGGYGTGYTPGDFFDIVPTATLTKRQDAIDPRINTLYVGHSSGGSGVTAITTPKVHCSVATLPPLNPTLAS